MKEVIITTNKLNPQIDPVMHVWSWDVSIYLFLGGLTAGILIIASLMLLWNKGKDYKTAYGKLALWGPIILTIGMIAIFLDVEHKLYAFNFYFHFSDSFPWILPTFQITSPMSWGAWIVMWVYPVNILLILITLKEGYPKLYAKAISYNIKIIDWLFAFADKYKKYIAMAGIMLGLALGVYTGILLSAFGARPFWNSSILGPIFLVSGLSTATALVVILSKDHHEKLLFTKADLMIIVAELFLIALLVIGMFSSTDQHIQAAKLIFGGELTSFFWVFIVGMGLSIPALLEFMEVLGKKISIPIAAILVLFGGFLLRQFMVTAGQLSTWIGW